MAVSRQRNHCWKEKMKETIRGRKENMSWVVGLWVKMGTAERGKKGQESKVRGLGLVERRLLIYGQLKRETENSPRPKQSFLWLG